MLQQVPNFGVPLPRNSRYGFGVAKRITPWNPNTADWLVRQRGARTQDDVVAELAARGVKLQRAWLSRIENGAPFGADLLEALEDYYGSVPPPFEPPAEEVDNPDLAAAIRALVGILTPLVDQATEGMAARLRAVESELESLRAQREAGASPGRSAHRGTRG